MSFNATIGLRGLPGLSCLVFLCGLAVAQESIKEGTREEGAADSAHAAALVRETSVHPPSIEEGRKHWAFQPISSPEVPAIEGEWSAWPRNAIDQFVLEKLLRHGLTPSASSDRRTLIRRATFDLIGLPPTPQEVEDFLRDDSADAFERVLERLLASPHYGERWGRYWLDLARYSDSNGLDENLAMANAWRYRDYVIRAFNEDRPYDQFILEQLAGDLLPEPDEKQRLFDQLTATGFLVLGPKMLAEQDKPKLVIDVVDEQIDVAARAFMGLTLGCARCHDHKFDPIPTADYYGIAGIFKSTRTMGSLDFVSRWSERLLATSSEVAALEEMKSRIKTAEAEIEGILEAEGGRLEALWRADLECYLARAGELVAATTYREAEQFDRGNLHVDQTQFGSAEVVIVRTNQGGLQFVEYDLERPEGGRFFLEVRHAAVDSRPMRLLVNGGVAAESVVGETSGDWHPGGQRWYAVAAFDLVPGRNTIRLERDGSIPHLDAWLLCRLEAEEERPAWRAEGSTSKGLSAEVLRRFVVELARVPLLEPPEQQSLKDRLLARSDLFRLPNDRLEPFLEPILKEDLANRRAALEALKKEAGRPVDHVLCVADDSVVDLPVHVRGSHLDLAPEKETRRSPAVFESCLKPAQIPLGRSGRLELARWLVHPGHPLTSRVMANRIFQGHFGRGIVLSASNFGMRGDLPTHPELLDWLAHEFIDRGWSIKAMHRLMMSSRAYQMSSQWRADCAARDPENHLLWRMNRRRLEAEVVRDCLLAIGGELDRTMGGSLLSIDNGGYVTNDQSANQALYAAPRRSIYLPVIRNAVFDLFSTFDFNDPGVPVDVRPASVIPQQSLFAMNSTLVHEQSRRLAQKIVQGAAGDEERLDRAALEVFARPMSTSERERHLAFLARLRARIELILAAQPRLSVPTAGASEAKAPEPPTREALELDAWKNLCHVLLSSSELIYVD